MDTELIFRIAVGLVMLTFIGIRVYYRKRARATRGKVEYKEGRMNLLFRVLVALTGFFILLIYLFAPIVIRWANLALPEGIRWLGVGLSIVTLSFFIWIHRALGKNFDGTLHIHQEQTLVMSGPYRWVRHPMYTAIYLLALSVLLMSTNAVVGGYWLVAFTLVLMTRVAHEERTMLEQFGDAYRAYMKHTTRFIPYLI